MTSHYVAKGKGGRGKKGGLSKYAERLGHKHPNIVTYRNAATVAEKVYDNIQVSSLLDKAAHLSATYPPAPNGRFDVGATKKSVSEKGYSVSLRAVSLNRNFG